MCKKHSVSMLLVMMPLTLTTHNAFVSMDFFFYNLQFAITSVTSHFVLAYFI